MVGCSLQKGHLAALLIGHRENVLETGITISKFIAPSLLCLDALTTSGLLPSICDTLSDVNTHVFVGIANDLPLRRPDELDGEGVGL